LYYYVFAKKIFFIQLLRRICCEFFFFFFFLGLTPETRWIYIRCTVYISVINILYVHRSRDIVCAARMIYRRPRGRVEWPVARTSVASPRLAADGRLIDALANPAARSAPPSSFAERADTGSGAVSQALVARTANTVTSHNNRCGFQDFRSCYDLALFWNIKIFWRPPSESWKTFRA